MLGASATAAEELRPRLIARGLHDVLHAELSMTDEGAELDDTAASLIADERTLRLRIATSLTAEGEALLDAAVRGAGRTHPVAVDDAWIDAALRADLRAMLEATERPPGLPAAGVSLTDALSEGGGTTVLYMALRHPFGVLRAFEQQARTERLPLPIEVLPTAAQVVWRGRSGDVPRVALALEWPRSYLDRPLTGMVLLAKREPGFESLRMDTLSPHGRPITVFGLGGEGAGAFDTGTDDGGSALLRARVSLSRIGADVATHDPERGAMLAAAGELRLTLDHREGALLGELTSSMERGDTPQADPVLHDAPDRPGAPRGSTVDAASRCLAAAGRAVADGLDVLSGVDGDAVDAAVDAALAKAEASLSCALAGPDTAEAARALRRVLVRLAAEAMAIDGRLEASRELLQGQCDRTKDAEICEEASAAPPR